MADRADRKSARRRVFALASLWAIAMFALGSMSGCYGRNCEGEVKHWGLNPGEGLLKDENTWASTAFDGKWLHFPGQRAWIFHTGALGADRATYDWNVQISAQEDPIHQGSFAGGAGNLAEISGVVPGQFVVRNGTCAEYYVYVVARAETRPPTLAEGGAPATPEAGTPDASGEDAGADAGDAGDGGIVP